MPCESSTASSTPHPQNARTPPASQSPITLVHPLPHKPPLALTTTYSIATSVTQLLSRSGHRAFNIPTNSRFRRSQLKFSNSPQSFDIILDTIASDLWVTSKDCTTCPKTVKSFDIAASSTLEVAHDSSGQSVPVTITYGAGATAAAGILVQDAVAMGGFRVQPQPWLLIGHISGNLLGSYDGIMGLAFDTISSFGGTPFWQTLAKDNKLATPEMSFWFARHIGDPNAQAAEFGGVFTLGGQNKTLYKGDVEFLPLITNAGRQTYWLLGVSGMYPISTRLVLDSF